MPTSPHDPNGIERWTLALHRLAVARLRADPARCAQALAVLDRWRAQRGPQPSDPYADEWRLLLRRGADAVEAAVCVESSRAAVLRSMSPLGFLITAQEREEARRAAVLELP